MRLGEEFADRDSREMRLARKIARMMIEEDQEEVEAQAMAEWAERTDSAK